MPIDPILASKEVSQGLSPICAMCERFWEAKNRGQDTCGRTDCGGPLGGKDFPQYRGILTQFDHWCFACGEAATQRLRIKGSDRMFAVCAKHLNMFSKPDVPRVKEENLVLAATKTGLIDPTSLVPKRYKKTLAEEIAEAETYFQEKEAIE